jgi:hypothetical protein
MLDKNWGEATGAKQEIEQAQRDRTKERKEKGEEFQPRYFEADVSHSLSARAFSWWLRRKARE